MTKAEQTRLHILEKAAPVFNKKGFDGTSLADLEKATGLTKGSLYGNFSGKDRLAMDVFQYSMRKVKELVRSELKGKVSCKDQLLALLNFYAKYVFTPPVDGGCPLLNTAVEADDYRAPMRRIVVAELHSTINFISGLIRKGIHSGEFKRGTKPAETAYLLFCLVEGALIFSRAERSDEPMKIIVRHCKSIIDQISIT